MGFSSSRISLNKEQKEKLKLQMEKSICKIRINGEDKGFGFFVNDHLTKKKILISKNEKKFFEEEKEKIDIELIINNSDPILLDQKNKRIIYSNENDNIIFLEIIQEDNLNEDHFLNFELNIYNKSENYENEKIYILPYRLRDEIEFPTGKIKKIEDDKNIIHDCKDIKDLKPFPILLLKNYKIIGINISQTNGLYLYKYLNEFKDICDNKIEDIANNENKQKEKDNEVKNKEIILKDEIKFFL